MAEEFILGMVAGVSIILGPQIYLYIRKLRLQLDGLTSNYPDTGETADTYNKETLAEKRP
jgi:hypothetical protein